MNDRLIEQIGQAIHAAQRYLVVTHIRPDGDAIGSLLGLGNALRQSGKPVETVCADGLPTIYRYLPNSDLVFGEARSESALVIVVDCSDLTRPGRALNGRLEPDINIDHHVTNLNFGRLNLVDISAVATAQVLAYCLPRWGFKITPEVAAPLMTGLITDTLGFRTNNMTPEALRLAADLMEAGANLPDIYMRSLVKKTYEATRLWGHGLNRLQREGRMVWTMLTREDRKQVGYPGRDDADLINVLSSIEQADVTIIFVEQANGSVKVSWRSQPGFDVSQVALSFGGGGHPAASGAEISGALEDVCQRVLQATREILVN